MRFPQGCPPLTVPESESCAGALARCARDSAHELHGNGRRRAGVRTRRRAAAAPQRRVVRDRRGQCGRRVSGIDARGRRGVADGGQPHDRRAHADRRLRHSADGTADDAAAGTAHRPDAVRRAGQHRHRLLGGTHQARRFPRHPRDPPDRIHLGGGGRAGRHPARHAAGHSGRDRHLRDRARSADGEPARLRAGTQAGHERLPPAFGRASRGRIVPRPAACCAWAAGCSFSTPNALPKRSVR